MKTFFRKENLKKTILSLVYLVVGVMFCILPVKMFNFVESALSVILLIVGIVGILMYSILSAEDKELKLLIAGIVGLILCICMFVQPRLFGIILSLIIGFSGVSMIISGLKLRKIKNNQWITDFIIGVIVSVLAVVTIILSGTKVAEKIIAIFFGVMCLVNGIYSLIELIILAKNENKNTKLMTVQDVKIEENKPEGNQPEQKGTIEANELEIAKDETENKEDKKSK